MKALISALVALSVLAGASAAALAAAGEYDYPDNGFGWRLVSSLDPGPLATRGVDCGSDSLREAYGSRLLRGVWTPPHLFTQRGLEAGSSDRSVKPSIAPQQTLAL